jgi:enolase-phosphatase E1
MKAILLDIEGTTTPIDFVHKTLFPFARERIADYVRENVAELRPEIAQLTDERLNEPHYSAALDVDSPDSIAAFLKFLIDDDRKSTPLKSIQGKIWQAGYKSGELRSVVFDDVPTAFERWEEEGTTIAIYSSGSVLAQKLLFQHTNHGDLTPYISRYFDTTTGCKRDAASYSNIAGELGLDPVEILFVSDITTELDAARTAGMQTALSIRPGNAAVPEPSDHDKVTSLIELNI